MRFHYRQKISEAILAFISVVVGVNKGLIVCLDRMLACFSLDSSSVGFVVNDFVYVSS